MRRKYTVFQGQALILRNLHRLAETESIEINSFNLTSCVFFLLLIKNNEKMQLVAWHMDDCTQLRSAMDSVLLSVGVAYATDKRAYIGTAGFRPYRLLDSFKDYPPLQDQVCAILEEEGFVIEKKATDYRYVIPPPKKFCFIFFFFMFVLVVLDKDKGFFSTLMQFVISFLATITLDALITCHNNRNIRSQEMNVILTMQNKQLQIEDKVSLFSDRSKLYAELRQLPKNELDALEKRSGANPYTETFSLPAIIRNVRL